MWDYNDRRCLVTGGDGFIGSHLVEALATAGARVTALAQYNSFDQSGWLDDLPAALRDRVTVVRGDIRDPFQIDELVRGQDVVFHLAALIAIPFSYAAPQSYVETNVTGTLNVLQAVRTHAVPRMVHTSTSEVYGTAVFSPITEAHPLQGQSPYSASKIGADMMAEAYARSFETPVVILRPFNTYGPRQSERAVIPTVIRQVLDPACQDIRLGDLSPVRDFNYVGDTVAAFLAAGAASGLDYGSAYNAGSGTAVTIGDMVETVRGLTGTTKPITQEAHRHRPENSEVRLLLADSTRLREAAGWAPRTDLTEGLRQTIDWWTGRVEAGALRATAGFAT